MVALQPFQEGDVFFQYGRIDRGRSGFQPLHGLAHQGGHRLVVLDRGVDVAQALGQALAQGVAAFLGHGIDDQDDDRQSASVQRDDGVEEGAHRDPGLGQDAHDAVHQEGGVVLDDADQVIVQGLAVGARQRPHGDQGRGAGRIVAGGAPGGGEQGGQILAVQLRRFVGGVVLVRLSQEGALRLARAGSQNPRE